MTRTERLEKTANDWRRIYKATHRHDALANMRAATTAALMAGASRKCKRRLKQIRGMK